jgi:hypothetical protein
MMKNRRSKCPLKEGSALKWGQIVITLWFRGLLILGIAAMMLLFGCDLFGPSSDNGDTNTAPVLSGGDVDPDSGDPATTFTYQVSYYDQNGDAPTAIEVNIGGTANTMTLISGSAENGTYQYSTTLAAGSHNYFFYCEDGQGGSDRAPTSGTSSGPTVTASPNNLSGSINYTGSVGVSGSQPLRVDVWSTPAMSLADSDEFTGAPFDFSFDLAPGNYTLTIYIDLDQNGYMSEDDVFSIYDGIYYPDDYDVIDLTGGDQDVGTIALDDSNVFVFYETFDDGTADDWYTDSDPRWQVTGGQYVMTGIEDDDVAVAVYNRSGISDFTYRVSDLQWLDGYRPDSDWGLIFRFDILAFEGFALSLDDYGWWGLYSVTGMGSTEIFEEDTGYASWDTVTIEFDGDTLTVFINGSQRWSGDVSAYGHSDGYVGLYAWDDDLGGVGQQQYAYDDIWLVLHQ